MNQQDDRQIIAEDDSKGDGSEAISRALEEELRSSIARLCTTRLLRDVIKYALFPAGKRLRPTLSLNLCLALNGDWRKILPTAVALEYLHNASLIHDDLPELDNDDVRRGRPSSHKVFGAGLALLAGDAMVPQAILSITHSTIEDAQKTIYINILCDSYNKVCEGQVLDAFESGAELLKVFHLKTAALFGAATEIAAIGAHSSLMVREAARKFGECFGLGFQMLNDYYDLFGTEAERGRPTSSDSRDAERNIFSSLTLEEARSQISYWYSQSTAMLAKIREETKSEGKRVGDFSSVESLVNKAFSSVILESAGRN